VPIARHEAGNPNFVCALFGSTTPFTAAQLRTRYGTSGAFVAAYRQRADAAVAARIMTAADRDAADRDAAAANAATVPRSAPEPADASASCGDVEGSRPPWLPENATRDCRRA
jgi:cell pole-organizing protein PopZ